MLFSAALTVWGSVQIVLSSGNKGRANSSPSCQPLPMNLAMQRDDDLTVFSKITRFTGTQNGIVDQLYTVKPVSTRKCSPFVTFQNSPKWRCES